jgi:hypothetical protein
MGTDKEDTDPSSPSALRPNSQGGIAVARAVPDPSSGQPTTDPGLGPAAGPPPQSTRRPMGVTVPAPSVRPRPGPSAITPPEITPIAAPLSATPSPAKDSVELLLEGMTGPRAERRKTTPQSDGEASAAYHAEHGVRRARTSEPAGPKVVVERPAVGGVLRERRPSPVPAKLGSREAMSTFVPARVLRRRVAMALLAGVLFVLLSFMAFRLTGRQGSPQAEATASPAQLASPLQSGAASTAMPASPTQAAPAEAPAAAEPAQATAGPVEPGSPLPPTQAPETTHAGDSRPSMPGHVPSGAPSARHHHAPGDAPAGQPGDLGEFKSKF